MNLNPQLFTPIRGRYLPLISRLESLFHDMDKAYTTVARQYGFECNGCKDNCCLTRFYHHTLLEYLFLFEGMRTLGSDTRHQIRQRAQAVDAQMDAAGHDQGILRIMCPLNHEGRCRLYDHRPMICRLHGIPFELHRPGHNVIRQPGCDAFFDQCRQIGRTDYIPFDRTPFYRQMAEMEKEMRTQTEYTGKVKLTIAQMLTTFTDSHDEVH
jgi:Fe-S-cluster containining protein